MKTTTSTFKHSSIVSACCHRVTFNYWDIESELTDELREELESHAEERAKELLVDGCSSGELNFFNTDTEEEIGGWWQIES